jgi:hypothetical protein
VRVLVTAPPDGAGADSLDEADTDLELGASAR